MFNVEESLLHLQFIFLMFDTCILMLDTVHKIMANDNDL
jgi:hypothetical protein